MKLVWIVLSFSIIAAIAVGTVQDHFGWECTQCHVFQDRTQWLFQLGGFTQALAPVRTVSEFDSWIRRDFYPAGHAHKWRRTGGGVRGLVQSSIRDDWPPLQIAVTYENDGEFRAFLRRELDSRAVSHDQLLQMFALLPDEVGRAANRGIVIDDGSHLLDRYHAQR